jgi:hypothetical protein
MPKHERSARADELSSKETRDVAYEEEVLRSRLDREITSP